MRGRQSFLVRELEKNTSSAPSLAVRPMFDRGLVLFAVLVDPHSSGSGAVA